jgi:hypothetical protein
MGEQQEHCQTIMATRAWQVHGESVAMAMTWQEHGKVTAITRPKQARQDHVKDNARAWQAHVNKGKA